HVIVERAFWAAAGLAAIGGIGPLIAAAGHTNRLAGIVVPFLGAAGANGVLAVLYRRGRSFAALVYFIGGLAIAYGLLLVLAIPLRIAVEGSCPPAPQRCSAGQELQLSSVETLGLSIAVGFGALALLTGFFGLLALYRRGRAATQGPSVWPKQEPAGWKKPAAAEDKPEEAKAEEAKAEEPPAEAPAPEPPQAEAPQAETPQAEAPPAEAPRADSRRPKRRRPKSPRPEEPPDEEAAEPPPSG
ncbi:MAG TPA: hypothetical protein VF993_02530, partial [Myxococcales bacterium]